MSKDMWAIIATDGQPLEKGRFERPDFGPEDILIRTKAAGLNRADLVQRAGLYPPPKGASPIMGLECAGVVEAIGDKVTEWAIGDPVCALMAGGGYAEFVAAHQGSVFKIPSGMSFVEASALPEAMMTVWANIFDRCALQKGESLLVHGGTSGIGSMALQMARYFETQQIFTTVGSAAKADAAHAFGATRAIQYKEDAYEKIVKDEGGADVILDIVGGDYVQKNISAAKTDGRICNIAYMKTPKVELNLIYLMMKRLVLMGTTLRARSNAYKQTIRDAVLADFWPGILDGSIKPVVDTIYRFDHAEEAQAHMQRGGHIGKIILSDDEIV